MTEEDVLKIIMETEPTDRSPYGITGHPPVWPVLADGERTLFIHPKRVLERAGGPEVAGYFYQWKAAGIWQDQGRAGAWQHLEAEISAALAAGARPLHPDCDEMRP